MAEETRTATLKEQVSDALADIRPSLAQHGGDVELVDVDEQGLVSVRLTGACHGCPGAMMTLQMGIERLLKKRVPDVTAVVAA